MKVNRIEFLTALKQVMPGIESDSVLLEGSDSFIFHDGYIHTYNDNISVSIPFPILDKNNVNVSGAIKAKDFYNLLNRYSGDSIHMIPKKDKWILKSENAVAELTLLENTLIDKVKGLFDDKNKYVNIPEKFIEGISICLFSSNKSVLAGIFVENEIITSTDEIRINWSGGSSHYQDVFILKDVLPAIAKKYPEAKIMMMGCHWDALTKEIPKDQYQKLGWVPTEAYPYKQAILDIDISIIPLEDNSFNRCKSHIKLIEQSFLGVPSVVSMVEPYRSFYAGNNMVMVNNDDASWFEGISRLIEDEQLRRDIGRNAEIKARAEFDADKQAHQWADAYAKLAEA